MRIDANTFETSPRFAFFDVDDTLIRIKSMFDFFNFWAATWLGHPALAKAFNARFAEMRAAGLSREELNRAYYRFFAGIRPMVLEEAAAAWAQKWLAAPDSILIAPSVSKLEVLRTAGIHPVFVSGSFPAILKPFARHLEVENILATKMLLDQNERFSGEIGTPQTIGKGKAAAIRAFLVKQGAQPTDCHAFGDDISDLPMLEAVGTAYAIGDNTALADEARIRNWTVIPV